MNEFLVVTDLRYFEFADGHWHYPPLSNLIKATSNLDEALRKLNYAQGDGTVGPKIVRVKVTFEEVNPDEIRLARYRKAQTVLDQLSDEQRALLKEFMVDGVIEPLITDVWMVKSFTAEGVEYKVTNDHKGEWTCSCPNYVFRPKTHPCKHVEYVQAWTQNDLGHVPQDIRRVK